MLLGNGGTRRRIPKSVLQTGNVTCFARLRLRDLENDCPINESGNRLSKVVGGGKKGVPFGRAAVGEPGRTSIDQQSRTIFVFLLFVGGEKTRDGS